MGHFSKKNVFVYCCISACLSLVTYLVAFSCEISWVLEAHGNLPTAAYLLCAGYFILFISSTILIHGLSTGISWGLLSWCIIIGILSIPELGFVIYMTLQYWGLQSTHGLTELICYLIRLIVNCLALLCVIPTALKWRQEKRVLSQLESLASRLQLTTPTPTTPFGINKTGINSLRGSKRMRRQSVGFDNPGYISQEQNSMDIVQHYTQYNNMYGSQSEFNASIFGLNPSQYIGPPMPKECKKTQSLVDLRYIYPPPPPTKFLATHNIANEQKSLREKAEQDKDDIDSVINMKNKINDNLNNNHNHHKTSSSIFCDPIYHTIEAAKNSKILGRNCVSLENLGAICTTDMRDVNNKDIRYGPNLLRNHVFNPWNVFPYAPTFGMYQQNFLQYPPINYFNYPVQQQNGHHPNSNSYLISYPQFTPNNGSFNYSAYLNSGANSRQSLGNESDDFRKYRDVAL